MNLELDIDPHSVCRICLSQKSATNNLFNYFSNTVVEGYVKYVPEMVMKCLDIESDADDGLPNKLCDVCKKQITNFYLFKEKSARTEEILLNAFDKPKRNRKPVSDDAKPPTSTVSIQTETEPPFACLDCRMTFRTETLLGKHIKHRHYNAKANVAIQTDELSVIDEDQDNYIVDELPESMALDYKREMKLEVLVDEEMHVDMDYGTSEHNKSDDDGHTEYEIVEKVQDDQDEQEYQCHHCLEIFHDVDAIQHHKCPAKVIVQVVNELSNAMEESDDVLSDENNYYEELIHEVDLYECYRCHATYANLEDFTAHRNGNDCEPFELKVQQHPRSSSKGDDYHHCNLCHKRFKTTTTFNQHQKLHESIGMVIDYLDCSPCDDCHKIFLLKAKKSKHDCPKKRKNDDGDYIDPSCTDYQYLEPDSDFSCDECSLEFANLSTAKQHVVTHAKEFVCPFEGCGCTYEIWSRFAMHLGTKHLNAKRHQCRFCEVECETFDALQAHYKDECPEKKFKCGHCDKSYFSQKALNLHVKDITKGKTFNCTYCNKSFNRRGELDLHNRSHTNERPYSCTICGKAYKTSSMRAAHMDAHIEGKTFPCTMCDKKLQTRTSYRNHMKRHTEEKKHECEHCGKKFFTKFHVKLHASKIHARPKTKAPQQKAASNVVQIDYEDVVDSMDDEQVVSSYE